VSTSDILGVAGAVVGGFFGYPQLGYAIGSAIGGAIDPQVIKGPRIGDSLSLSGWALPARQLRSKTFRSKTMAGRMAAN